MEEKISVVIPTIGLSDMLPTIESLNNGLVIPDEIIIVIPKEVSPRIEYLKGINVRIVTTNFFGQVKQRNYGIMHARNELILQLDDDVLLAPGCLRAMLRFYKVFGEKAVVGPRFIFEDGENVWPIRSRPYQIFSTLFWGTKTGVNRFGSINLIGNGHGVDFSIYRESFKLVSWLAGGCVLSHRKSYPVTSHFPFSGKAYCEDVMQSILQRKSGIIHFCLNSAVCRIYRDNITGGNGYSVESDFRARGHVLYLLGKVKLRLYIWYLYKKVFWLLKSPSK